MGEKYLSDEELRSISDKYHADGRGQKYAHRAIANAASDKGAEWERRRILEWMQAELTSAPEDVYYSIPQEYWQGKSDAYGKLESYLKGEG